MSKPMVRLISGTDEVLLAEALRSAVTEAVGTSDRFDVLDEFSGEEYVLDDVLIAASTPPMLSSHRVVVARGLSRFGSAGIAPLLAWLENPCPTTDLVLEWDAARVPRSLAQAVEAAGGERVASEIPGGARNRRTWLEEHLAQAPVLLDASARASVTEHLGAELNRLAALLETLAGVFGADARLSAEDVAPYLGTEGDVPPWELTDAIDSGNVATTLAVLQRMWGARRHPLAVTAVVANHIGRMARLDGANAVNEKEAAALLGLRGSTFPARKALTGCRRRGSDGLARAVELLARADLDLRGKSGLDARCIAELLCVRLAASAS